MASTTLPSNNIAKDNATGVQFAHHIFKFSGAVNTDGNTIEVCKLPPNSTIINVILRATDLDSGTDVEIDVGLTPAPGLTTADADILIDGALTFTTAGLTQIVLAPTESGGVITAGAGIKTHAELTSTLFLTLVDQGDATSGTIYTQVFYAADVDLEVDVVVNA